MTQIQIIYTLSHTAHRHKPLSTVESEKYFNTWELGYKVKTKFNFMKRISATTILLQHLELILRQVQQFGQNLFFKTAPI